MKQLYRLTVWVEGVCQTRYFDYKPTVEDARSYFTGTFAEAFDFLPGVIATHKVKVLGQTVANFDWDKDKEFVSNDPLGTLQRAFIEALLSDCEDGFMRIGCIVDPKWAERKLGFYPEKINELKNSAHFNGNKYIAHVLTQNPSNYFKEKV